ncbi:MAG: PAS domain-containing hybrid sensor histidine kinase/response regulator [Planctomycetota bacterium]|jgi:PAS domain S-box-containing protein
MVQPKSGRRLRWYHLYFLLAVFDLLTVGISLYLNHRSLEIYVESVEVNQVWANRLNHFANLAHLAEEANAPGNEVFESGEIDACAKDFERAHAVFQEELVHCRAVIRQEMDVETSALLGAHIEFLDERMQGQAREARAVFAELSQGNREAAGRHMAAMDRLSHGMTDRLLELTADIHGIQGEIFAEQKLEAQIMGDLEILILGMIGLMVLGVAYYGQKINRNVRRQQDALLEMRAALKAYPDRVFLFDLGDYQVRYASQEADEVVVGSTQLFERLPEIAEAELRDRLSELSASGNPHLVYRTEATGPSGDPRFVEVRLNLVGDGTKAKSCLAMVRDVTALAKSELELSLHKRAIDEHAIVAVTDRDGRFVHVNDKFCDISKYSREELLGHDHRMLHSGHHEEDFLRDLYDTIYAGGVWTGEIKSRANDGSFFWADTTRVPHLLENGELEGFIALRHDITDLKSAQDVIHSSEARLTMALAAAQEGLWDWGIESGESYLSDHWFGMLGYGPDELPVSLQTFENLVHPADLAMVRKHFQGAIEGDTDRFECEIRMRTKTGSWKWILDIGEVIERNEAGQGTRLVGVHIDIDGTKQVQKELEDARERAETASQAKSEFLANMSHEIRTPMTAILGFADLLSDEGVDPEMRKEYVATMKRNGEHLMAIINDILDLSKIEAGKMALEGIKTSVFDVLDEAVDITKIAAQGKRIPLRVEYATPLPEFILSDPVRLRQVLVNLISNAIKFTESGGVTVSVAYERTNASPLVCFTVCDTGLGMTREQIDGLFEAFAQVDTSLSRMRGGTGLGLKISQKLAMLLGGEIEVQSQPGLGSTFMVSIKAVEVEGARLLHRPELVVEEQEQPIPQKPTRSRLPLEACRILLAEDGRDNQLLISHVLRKAGAEVKIAENGRVAVDAVSDAENCGEPFDLILMDMQMPEMDGYTATETLRASGSELPIVAITAHAMTEDRERCLASGCSEYATKPIDKNGLIDLCRRMSDWS